MATRGPGITVGDFRAVTHTLFLVEKVNIKMGYEIDDDT